MKNAQNNRISRTISVFHGRPLPEPEVLLVGYAALIEAYELRVPLPRMKSAIDERFDMPDHKADLLIRFLAQNKGIFSKRASAKEVKALSTAECRELESLYAEIFSHAGTIPGKSAATDDRS